jgi:RNase P subunit RPR2
VKLCVKRIYCPGCQRLVKCREQPVNDAVNIVCSRCGNPIWIIKGGITWRYAARKGMSKVGSGQAEGA